jgi:hypothetical protein
VRGKFEGASACAESSPGQATANAASAARAARLQRGDEITARRLHLADGRLWRGRAVQDGLFASAPQ